MVSLSAIRGIEEGRLAPLTELPWILHDSMETRAALAISRYPFRTLFADNDFHISFFSRPGIRSEMGSEIGHP